MVDPDSHEAQAAADSRRRPVCCAVLTVSDTRTTQTDQSGPLIERLLADARHETVARSLVDDDPQRIGEQLEQWLADPGIDAILITGGTGIAPRDGTIEVVRRLLTVELDGFGFGSLNLHELDVILDRGGLQFFSIEVSAGSSFVVEMTHYDLFLGGGWSTGGAPLGFTNPLSSMGGGIGT